MSSSDGLAKNKGGWTALMHAAKNGSGSCVKLLIPVSDAFARRDNGMGALIVSALELRLGLAVEVGRLPAGPERQHHAVRAIAGAASEVREHKVQAQLNDCLEVIRAKRDHSRHEVE